MDITVAICTYNGAERLPAVLNRLAVQHVLPNAAMCWEVVVVDNNSADDTKQVVKAYQASAALPYKLTCVDEFRQGLAFARRRAIQVAEGALVAFLDDDNLPDENWLQAVYSFGRSHPSAGAYGSQIIGRYESPPPLNFDRIACFLAVIGRGDRAFRYDQLDRWLFPAGAGLVVRRQAWLDQVPAQPKLTGVSANGLNGKGEDIETLSYLRKGGLPIWHNPEMKVEHVIERDRLTKHYLLKLFKGVGLSRYHTRTIRFKRWQRSPVVFAYFLKDLCHLLVHSLKHAKSASTIVTSCERTLLYYSILSPFYHALSLRNFGLVRVSLSRYGLARYGGLKKIDLVDDRQSVDEPSIRLKSLRADSS